MATDDIVGVLLDFGSSSHRVAGCRASRRQPAARLSRPAVVRGLAHFDPQWEQSLAGHWRLDEAFGTRLDVLGASPLADNGGVSWEPGKIGNAATFDSSLVQYLQAASNPNLQLGGGSFTIALWAKFNTVTGSRPLVWKYDEPTGQREYSLGYESGRMVLRVYPDGSLGSVQTLTTSGSLSASTWYFIVAGYDALTLTLRIRVYQPGYADLAAGGAVSAVVTGGAFSGTAPFRVGYGNLPGYVFSGSMDSLWIWKRTLSIDEELNLFNQGSGYEPSLTLPQRHLSRQHQGWRDGWRGHHGRAFRLPVPNLGQADPAHVLRSRLIHPPEPQPASGRVARGITHYDAGIPLRVIPRHRLSREGPLHLPASQIQSGRAHRRPVPHGEFWVHQHRIVQGWRGGIAPTCGNVIRHHVPGVRGLERIPHRTADGWRGGIAPGAGRSRRGTVPGSGLSDLQPVPSRFSRPPGFVPWGARHNRIATPSETGGVEYVWLVDENGNPVVDEFGNLIILRDGLGLTAAQVVRRHRVASGRHPPPWRGGIFRRPVPPSGLAQAARINPHTFVRSPAPRPATGCITRRPVPNQGQIALPIIPRRTATAPRPCPERLRAHVRRGCTRMPFLSNSGQVIAGAGGAAGRYYVTAGQIYVAGAVAGQVVVE